MREILEIEPNGPVVHAFQITDTHIASDPDERYDGVDTLASLNDVIGALLRQDPAPDFVLATGDLANDPTPGAYGRLLHSLERLPVPVCCLPGNHDDPELMTRMLPRGRISAPRAVRSGNWILPLLNTCVPGREGGRLSGSELAFLDSCLRSDGATHALVCLHHPPVSVGSPWMDAMGLDNGADLFRIVDASPAVKAVLWGHIHQRFDQCQNGVRLLGTPSTCVQFTPGSDRYIKAEAQPGYRSLRLNPDGKIDTSVHELER